MVDRTIPRHQYENRFAWVELRPQCPEFDLVGSGDSQVKVQIDLMSTEKNRQTTPTEIVVTSDLQSSPVEKCFHNRKCFHATMLTNNNHPIGVTEDAVPKRSTACRVRVNSQVTSPWIVTNSCASVQPKTVHHLWFCSGEVHTMTNEGLSVNAFRHFFCKAFICACTSLHQSWLVL